MNNSRPTCISNSRLLNIFDQGMTSELFEEVESVAKKGGTGKRASWKGALTIADPALIGEASVGGLALTFALKAAKTDSDQERLVLKSIDRQTGQEVITKEVVVNQDGNIDLKSHMERRSFTADKFDPKTLHAENTFLPELYLAGTAESVPKENVVTKQGEEEVVMFERVKNLEIEGAVHLGRLSEYKFKELYMLKPDSEAHETPERIRKFARTLLERQLALKCFFSWGRGFAFYSAIIYPYERSEDGRLWLILGLAEGRTTYDEAWSLAQGKTEKQVEPVPLVRRTPKVKIS